MMPCCIQFNRNQPHLMAKCNDGHSLHRRVRGSNCPSERAAIARTRRLRRQSQQVRWILFGWKFVRDGHAAWHSAYLCAFHHTLHLLDLPKCSRLYHGNGIVQCQNRNRCGSCPPGAGSHPECFAVRIGISRTAQLNLTSSYWVQRPIVV